MTGAIVLPSGITAMSVKGTGYNVLGGSGGVAFRNNTTNILNHTATEVVAYVPITTSGTGVGVRFGSGGPSLSKSGTSIAASAPITVAAAPATAAPPGFRVVFMERHRCRPATVMRMRDMAGLAREEGGGRARS
jgi:hypothetical protein